MGEQLQTLVRNNETSLNETDQMLVLKEMIAENNFEFLNQLQQLLSSTLVNIKGVLETSGLDFEKTGNQVIPVLINFENKEKITKFKNYVLNFEGFIEHYICLKIPKNESTFFVEVQQCFVEAICAIWPSKASDIIARMDDAKLEIQYSDAIDFREKFRLFCYQVQQKINSLPVGNVKTCLEYYYEKYKVVADIYNEDCESESSIASEGKIQSSKMNLPRTVKYMTFSFMEELFDVICSHMYKIKTMQNNTIARDILIFNTLESVCLYYVAVNKLVINLGVRNIKDFCMDSDIIMPILDFVQQNYKTYSDTMIRENSDFKKIDVHAFELYAQVFMNKATPPMMDAICALADLANIQASPNTSDIFISSHSHNQRRTFDIKVLKSLLKARHVELHSQFSQVLNSESFLSVESSIDANVEVVDQDIAEIKLLSSRFLIKSMRNYIVSYPDIFRIKSQKLLLLYKSRLDVLRKFEDICRSLLELALDCPKDHHLSEYMMSCGKNLGIEKRKTVPNKKIHVRSNSFVIPIHAGERILFTAENGVIDIYFVGDYH
jgi:hypothetical protein